MGKEKWIKDGWSGQTKLTFCPNCFHRLDGTTSLSGKEAPVPGDFSVCIECGSVLRFKQSMELEMSSLAEVPLHIRMDLAKLVRTVQTEGPYASKRWRVQ